MEEGEKKPDAGTISGNPQKKIVYAVIAVAVVILAVVLIAKFGYNTDLLNPAGGQMSLVQRPPITLVRPNITISEQEPRLVVTTPPFHRVTTPFPRLCKANQTGCNGVCVCQMTDTQNCGACGLSCSGRQCGTHQCNLCSNGQCIYDPTRLCEGVVCSAGLSCSQGRCVPNDELYCGN
jgi:hypothetical protein